MTDCVATGERWHRTCSRTGTPQHWPKRSQGGTEVVAYPCWYLHDALDNGVRLDGRRVENYVDETGYHIRDRETLEVLL